MSPSSSFTFVNQPSAFVICTLKPYRIKLEFFEWEYSSATAFNFNLMDLISTFDLKLWFKNFFTQSISCSVYRVLKAVQVFIWFIASSQLTPIDICLLQDFS